jgi:hypothetical protein
MGATHVTARFDFILNPQASGRPAIENTVLFETRFFAVVPWLISAWLAAFGPEALGFELQYVNRRGDNRA